MLIVSNKLHFFNTTKGKKCSFRNTLSSELCSFRNTISFFNYVTVLYVPRSNSTFHQILNAKLEKLILAYYKKSLFVKENEQEFIDMVSKQENDKLLKAIEET